MNRRTILPYAVLIILFLGPGCLMLLYSYTFITSGIGAVDFWWAPPWYIDYGEATLNVSQSCPVATETINAEGLRISLNSNVAMVSVEVVGARSGILLNRSPISEVAGEVTFPVGHPTEWIESQDFSVNIFWEGFNATVNIMYTKLRVGHADGSVYYTLPGFYGAQSFGSLLLQAGLVILVVSVSVIVARNGPRRRTRW